MKLYSSKQIARQTGVNYRTLMRWIAQDLIEPAVRGKPGRQTWFTEKGFREVAILAKLRSFLSLSELREAIEYLRKRGHNPFSTGDFAVMKDVRGERALMKICEQGEVIQMLEKNPGQLRLFPVYDIEEVITATTPEEHIEDE